MIDTETVLIQQNVELTKQVASLKKHLRESDAHRDALERGAVYADALIGILRAAVTTGADVDMGMVAVWDDNSGDYYAGCPICLALFHDDSLTHASDCKLQAAYKAIGYHHAPTR